MAPSRLRKAIGAVKDQTSIGLAKVGRSSSLSDLEVAIVKATRHQEHPPHERYISEIISLTSYSRALVNACVGTIARRLDKTRNWVVALKSLMLVQRLLSEGDPAYEPEIFFATRAGTRLLNMSNFRDASGKVDAWDYSAFVRTYAMYLDEHLEFRMQGRKGRRGGGYSSYRGDEEEDGGYGGGAASEAKMVTATPVREMKKEGLFCRVHHLVQLLERFVACRPAGAAKHHRVVAMAVYHIVKESIQLYDDITETTGVLIDRFMQLEIPDMVRVYEIFCRLSKQYDELDAFYDWCKIVGIIRFSEYPYVEKIPQKKLDVMDDLIHQKSAMLQYRKRATSAEPNTKPVEEASEVKPQEDLFKIKALPPCEGFVVEEEKKPKEEKKKVQEVGDLLNLCDDAPSTEEQGHKLALALFNGGPATAAPANTTPPWEAFKDSSGDWEMALVESVSHLSNQKASLAGGFDTLILDGMYQHGEMTQAVAGSSLASGSASSVALGSAGRPTMLALPAPPTAANGGPHGLSLRTDPFAASLAIEPPPYVQMSEMEKKQRFLVQEQLMWQQYARNGMHGQGQERLPYQYNRGGYGHI